MADTCINDTNSVDLSFNGTGELEADVRLRSVATGSITEDANGIGVTLSPSGGLQHSASGEAIKVAQGLFAGTEGLMKVNGYNRVGSPVPENVVVHNFSILRGSNTVAAGPLTLTGSLPSNELASTILAHAQWRGAWSTTFEGFGPSNAFDGIAAFLQIQWDGGGWANYDYQSLATYRMAGTFSLDAFIPLGVANGTVHTLQARLVVQGATISGTAVQGVLSSSYGGCLEWWY